MSIQVTGRESIQNEPENEYDLAEKNMHGSVCLNKDSRAADS